MELLYKDRYYRCNVVTLNNMDVEENINWKRLYWRSNPASSEARDDRMSATSIFLFDSLPDTSNARKE